MPRFESLDKTETPAAMIAGAFRRHAGDWQIFAIPMMQLSMENFEVMALALGCIGTVCWAVYFWWMHRISSRQNSMLEELHEMTTRIEKLSQVEHDLISDVHPQVSESKEHVESVREVVSPEKS